MVSRYTFDFNGKTYLVGRAQFPNAPQNTTPVDREEIQRVREAFIRATASGQLSQQEEAVPLVRVGNMDVLGPRGQIVVLTVGDLKYGVKLIER